MFIRQGICLKRQDSLAPAWRRFLVSPFSERAEGDRSSPPLLYDHRSSALIPELMGNGPINSHHHCGDGSTTADPLPASESCGSRGFSRGLCNNSGEYVGRGTAARLLAAGIGSRRLLRLNREWRIGIHHQSAARLCHSGRGAGVD